MKKLLIQLQTTSDAQVLVNLANVTYIYKNTEHSIIIYFLNEKDYLVINMSFEKFIRNYID